MKLKTNELTGTALDWAVAKCLWPDAIGNTVPFHSDGGDYAPSTNWAHGGPIIEQERISVGTEENGWSANITTAPAGVTLGFGPTPLIAAMRCFVASRLVDEVEVPDELLEE